MTEFWDTGSFRPGEDGLASRDPLEWPGYPESLRKAAQSAGVDEAVQTGPATIDGHQVELAVFNFAFLGGSMGEVAGERLARAMERAAEREVPFVLYTSTGGARMQEGMVSLVQMAKVVAARLTLADSDQLYIVVLGHPTTGGVLASVGALADYTIAEAGATIGFAGPRLVKRFTGRSLREGSHSAQAAFAKGFVDEVVEPRDLRGRVGDILRGRSDPSPPDLIGRSSSSHRDPAVSAVVTKVGDREIVLMTLRQPFAPGPAGFRRAQRALGEAAGIDLPIVVLIDTPGADPSEDSEAGGIAWEIARLFEAMLTAPIPILAIVTGFGGSGGALAFATADRLVVYEDASFSVIAPDSAAEILWRDSSRGEEAARLLKPTAQDLYKLGIADEVIRGQVDDESIRGAIAYHLGVLTADDVSGEERSKQRHERWRNPTQREGRQASA